LGRRGGRPGERGKLESGKKRPAGRKLPLSDSVVKSEELVGWAVDSVFEDLGKMQRTDCCQTSEAKERCKGGFRKKPASEPTPLLLRNGLPSGMGRSKKDPAESKSWGGGK